MGPYLVQKTSRGDFVVFISQNTLIIQILNNAAAFESEVLLHA